jgi:hypothetical protein
MTRAPSGALLLSLALRVENLACTRLASRLRQAAPPRPGARPDLCLQVNGAAVTGWLTHGDWPMNCKPAGWRAEREK